MSSVEVLRNAAPVAAPPRFHFIRAADIEVTQPEWLIRGLLERDALALVFGDPGCGKSFLAVDWACSVATGREYAGHKVRHGPVLYLAGEGRNGIARRLEAWTIRSGESLEDAPLYLSSGPAALCDLQSAAEVQAAVAELAEAEGSPALVVVDTLARNFGPGDENSTHDMSVAIQAMDALRSTHRCTVLLVHHTGHADKTRARGAMALKGALDAEYRLERGEDGVTRLDATKMKDAPEPPPLAFKLRTVELGFEDDDGDPVTSAVLDPVEHTAPPKKGSAGRGRNQTKALAILSELYDEHCENVEADGRAPTEARVEIAEWREACADQGMGRKRFNEVSRSLEHNGHIRREGVHVFPL